MCVSLSECVQLLSSAIDFRFTQDEYLVREDAGTVMVCLEIATEGFLPRDVVMNLVTVEGNATGTRLFVQ